MKSVFIFALAYLIQSATAQLSANPDTRYFDDTFWKIAGGSVRFEKDGTFRQTMGSGSNFIGTWKLTSDYRAIVHFPMIVGFPKGRLVAKAEIVLYDNYYEGVRPGRSAIVNVERLWGKTSSTQVAPNGWNFRYQKVIVNVSGDSRYRKSLVAGSNNRGLVGIVKLATLPS